MSHSYYPVALDLDGKRCLVVGDGALALEKAEGLIRARAWVTTVGPSPVAGLLGLEAGGHLLHLHREYRSSYLDRIYLAYGASEDRRLNARVARDARERGILVNAVDDIPNCDFFAVAVVRRGDLQVAISTNGRSPAFARWMREELDAALPTELSDLLSLLGNLRTEIKNAGPIPEYEVWRSAISKTVMTALRDGDCQRARELIRAALAHGRTANENPYHFESRLGAMA